MGRRAPRPIDFALKSFKQRVQPKSELAQLTSIWEGVVGHLVAESSRPVRVDNGSLTVLCKSSVWAQEIELMSETLLEQINTELEGLQIHTLHCITGSF